MARVRMVGGLRATVLGLVVATGGVPAVASAQGASPSVTPAPATLGPTRAADMRMTAVTLPAGLPAAGLNAVTSGGPGYVAVGAVRSGDTGPVDTLILTSSDGLTWAAVDLGGLAQAGTLDDVVAFPGGLVAVGSNWATTSRLDGIALVSADGLTWQASTDRDLRNAFLAGVTTWGDGVVAVGCRRDQDGLCARPTAWTSSDGLEWQRVAMPRTAGDPNAVASGDGLLVVLGVSSVIADGRPVVTTTRDLASWTRREMGFEGSLESATIEGDHILAAGTLLDQDGDVLFRGVVTYSPNAGGRWMRLPLSAPDGSRFTGASFEGPVIAYGSREGADFATLPAVWLSRAGVDWTRIRGVPGRTRGEVTDFVPFPDRSGGIAVGALGEADVEPAVWVIAARGG